MTFPETLNEGSDHTEIILSPHQNYKEVAQSSLLESFDANKIHTLHDDHPDLRAKGVQKRGSEHKFTDWLIGTQFYSASEGSFHYIPINLGIESLTNFMDMIRLESDYKAA